MDTTAVPAWQVEPGLRGRTDLIFYEGYEDANWLDRWYIPSWWNKDGVLERRTDSGDVFYGNASLRIYNPPVSASNDQGDATAWLQYFFRPEGYDALYMRWYEKMEPSQYFVKGTAFQLKGNGLYGWNVNSSKSPGNFDPENPKFSLRASVSNSQGGAGAGPHVYSYRNSSVYSGNVGRRSFENDIDVYYTPGEWMCVEIYLKANDIGSKNGILRLWIDGKLVNEQKNQELRLDKDLKIKAISNLWKLHVKKPLTGKFSVTRWQDNLVVAKNRIRCMG